MKNTHRDCRSLRTETMKVLKKGNVKQTNEGVELTGWEFDAEGGAIDIEMMVDAAKEAIGEDVKA